MAICDGDLSRNLSKMLEKKDFDVIFDYVISPEFLDFMYEYEWEFGGLVYSEFIKQCNSKQYDLVKGILEKFLISLGI